MAEYLDADVALLNVADGRPSADEPPGLAAFAPPRRTARGRERDQLFLCLSLRSRQPVAAERYTALVQLAAATFFGSPGSVTSALRQAVAAVNQQLLGANLREGASGAPVQGGLICAALRGLDLYAVQTGPGLVLVAHPNSLERFPNLTSRPLGLSNTPETQYFHTSVAEGEFFCLSTRAASGWNSASLSGLGGLANLSLTAERLRTAAGEDLTALVGRFEPGGTIAMPTAPLASLAPTPSAPPRQALGAGRTAAPRPQPHAEAPRRAPTPNPLDSLASLGTGLAARLRPSAKEDAPAPAASPRTDASPIAPHPSISPTQVPQEGRRSGGQALEVSSTPTPRTPAPVETPAPDHLASLEAGSPLAAIAEVAPAPAPAPTTVEVPAPPALAPAPAAAEALAPAAEPAPAGAATGTNWPSLIQRAERLGSEPLPSIPVIEDLPSQAERAAPRIPSGGQGASPAGMRTSPSPRGASRSLARALGVTLSEAARGLRVLMARMLPEGVLQKQGLLSVPTSVQIAIAIVIPLLVVALTALIYIQRGRAEQFDDTFSQAQLEVATARAAPDVLTARPHWEAALNWLDAAEVLRPDDSQVAGLRQEAQGQLDSLDWITRLDFRPLVVGGLGREVKVARIALFGQDVFVLDEAANRILRVTPSANNTGYTIDPSFVCASGTVGQFTIGPLVDMALVSGPNVIGADAVVALDTLGGLLYCAPEARPLATFLPTPDSGWIRPSALEVYGDRLYVFDPGANEIWQYQAASGSFNQPPARYFGSGAANLSDVAEFTIASGDLFLLRRDGRMTNCTRPVAGESPSCTENVQYLDTRPGRGPAERLADVTQPTRLVFDPPPEPSLYLLDQSTSGLYQLSLKLALVRQFRPRGALAGPISAVAFDAAKQIYVGAGDNIYVAPRP